MRVPGAIMPSDQNQRSAAPVTVRVVYRRERGLTWRLSSRRSKISATSVAEPSSPASRSSCSPAHNNQQDAAAPASEAKHPMLPELEPFNIIAVQDFYAADLIKSITSETRWPVSDPAMQRRWSDLPVWNA